MLPALSALLYALLLLLPLAPTTVGAQVPLNLTKREQVFAFEHNFEAGRFAKIPQCQELTFGWTGDGVVDPVYLVIYGEGQRVQKMEVGQGSIGNGTAIIDADLNSVIYFTMQDGAGHSGGITGPWTIGTGNSSNCDPSPLTGSNISVSYNTPGTTKDSNGLATCPLGGLDISLLGAKGEATEVDVVLPEANPAGEYYTTLPLDHPSFSLNVSASAYVWPNETYLVSLTNPTTNSSSPTAFFVAKNDSQACGGPEAASSGARRDEEGLRSSLALLLSLTVILMSLLV